MAFYFYYVSGVTSNGIVLQNDSMTVLSGGVANNTQAYSSSLVYVSNGGMLNSTVVSRSHAYVYDDGIANDISINEEGSLNVLSDGVVNSAVINSSGWLNVFGGTVSSSIVSGGIIILSGGILNNTKVYNYNTGTVYISGGTANDLSGYGSFNVFDGEVNGLTARLGARIKVYGGTVNDVIIDQCEEMLISGGVVNSIYAEGSGRIVLTSGGTARNVQMKALYAGLDASPALYVDSGAKVENVLFKSGTVIVTGGTVDRAKINRGGRLYIDSGEVKEVYLTASGFLSVSSGGIANISFNPFIEEEGTVVSATGATVTHLQRSANVYYGNLLDGVISSANDISELDIAGGNSAIVYDGGSLRGVRVNSGASLVVSSGGTATLGHNPFGEGFISSAVGAAVSRLARTVNVYYGNTGNGVISSANSMSGLLVNCQSAIAYSGGRIDDAEVIYGGLLILSGGTANRTAVNTNGDFHVSSGGTANSVTVNSGGSLYVSSGGKANNISVNACGSLYVCSGGTATVLFDPFCSNDITTENGASISFLGQTAKVYCSTFIYGVTSADSLSGLLLDYYSDRLHVYSGGRVDDTIGRCGAIIISSGGTANKTILNEGGASFRGFTVYGIANDTEINLNMFVGDVESRICVGNGGVANNTTIKSGRLFVSSGGTANRTSVNSGGSLHVCSGGTATIAFNPFASSTGTITSETGVVVSNLKRDANVYYGDAWNGVISSANSMSGLFISGNGAIAYSGGMIDDTEIRYYGSLILSGGTANRTSVHGGANFHVSAGGRANDVRIGYDGWFYVSSGGVADNVLINSSGNLYVYSGGTATIAFNPFASSSETITSETGAVVSYLERDANVYYGNEGNGIFSSANSMSWLDIYGESAIVYQGGQVDNTMVNNGALILSGGTANRTTVSSSGSMFISGGGKITGRLTIESGAVVSMYEGAILNFDLTQTETGAAALLNDLSVVMGAPLYTLTVDGSQANGTYSLADGASSFNGTISVVNTAGDELGTLLIGAKVTIGGLDYTLSRNGGSLSVTVSGGSPAPMQDRVFFPGCFAGGTQAMLASQTDRTVTIYADEEVFGSGLVLDPGWEIAGVGDFNADGRDDFLRLNEEGYVVGEMTKITGAFSPQVLNFLNDGWQILGTGDFDSSGCDDVLVANPTGASETVGLLGYWEGGSTWVLINGYSAEWECIATGDFNADGNCDMLWRNSFEGEGGLTYNAYCTWLVGLPEEFGPGGPTQDWFIVSVANPDEWNFLCSGDFNGDNANDIAMINGEGVVGIWGVEGGMLSSWSILSAVDTSTWTLAGVRDFNGDGTDDIAWCNNSTGQVGCWQINDKTLTVWQTIVTIA